jgi:transcriptional regulator with PAS, ATPase and Fis domain
MKIQNLQSLKLKTKEIVEESLLYWQRNDIEKTLAKTNKLLKLGKDNNYPHAISRAQILLAAVDTFYNKYSEALEKLFNAQKIAIENGEHDHLSDIYNSIGRCYGLINNQEKSLEYLNKALDIDPDEINILSNIGVTLLRMQKPTEALEYFNRAIEKSNIDERNQFDNTMIYLNIGNTYFILEDYTLAEENYKKAIPLAEESSQRHTLALLYFSLAEVIIQSKNFDYAIELLNEALKIYEEIDSREGLKKVYERLAFLYKDLDNHEKSFYFLWKYSEEMKHFYDRAMNDKIEALEIKHQTEKQLNDAEISKLKNKQQAIERQFTRFKNLHSLKSQDICIFSETFRNIVELAISYHENRQMPVLIEGETGTGKEIIAKTIHYGNSKTEAPFISINCASISPELFESEFFGYANGAFTGASQEGKMGKFEMAHGGTIFLDEIGEMPISMQPKLLRVIQEREYYPIGSSQCVKLDVRIIAATNRDLKEFVKQNKFRSDLYFRLSAGKIEIPPLRKRRNEIIQFANFFMRKYTKLRNKLFDEINQSASEILNKYSWPGNIRELENCIERVVLLYNEKEIKPQHLNFIDSGYDMFEHVDKITLNLNDESLPMREAQQQIVNQVLIKCNGNKARAAEYLKISRKTIYKYL